MNLFIERLQKSVLLCDGAMGTLLYSRGISYYKCFDELNLSSPEVVQRVHQDYIRAGAEIIETNTFGANSFKLATHGFEERTKDINCKGAKIAREAREIEGKEVFVAGSIGPVGQRIHPFGDITLQQVREAFLEQGEGLLEGGVDLFIVETISDLREMKEAVSAIRSICQLPIIASMTFGEDGKTLMGNTPEEVTEVLGQLEVEVIGANCSVGPLKLYEVIQRMRVKTKKFISAQPNAGFPHFVEGRFIYLSSPEYMAEYAERFILLGVNLVGGCCGTTPEHIKMMAQVIRKHDEKASAKTGLEIVIREEPEEEKVEKPSITLSPFARNIGKEFLVSVELDPPKGTNPEKILKVAKKLKNSGINAVNIADSPMAKVRMSCLSLAYLLTEKVGIDVVLHFTCRDRNLMGLQSDLLGAHALGIRNILAVTGDPPSLGDYPHMTAVYDVDSVGLVKIIQKLNCGTDWAGNSIGSPTSFSVGVGVDPNSRDWDRELDRLKLKEKAGADYVFTQPFYDLETLKRFLRRIEGIKLPVFLGLLPLQSTKHAEFLHNEVPGILIPDEVRERMRKAGEKGAREGVQVCKELLKEAKSLVSGVYMIPSFGRFEQVLEVLE
ncbi:MAG: bifunctional homocysteine S-methyltransferase/methylenetetrahydrofolate reductase [candidate division Zixibacteria bacterium]|nr:bifunctional homocysteine S-methyltransferase/methylenetetrahydrofolate reductase [candidate division Zixibacteria bacterium]